VYRQGRSFANRQLAVYAFPRPDEEGTRLGLSVGRKVGGAVDRNRVKRLLREAFGDVADRLPSGHDIVVVARPDVGDLADREGLAGVERALEELVAKVGPSEADA